MHKNWTLEPSTSFKLSEESVDIVNVFWPFNFGNHDDINFVAGLCDDVGDVV